MTSFGLLLGLKFDADLGHGSLTCDKEAELQQHFVGMRTCNARIDITIKHGLSKVLGEAGSRALLLSPPHCQGMS